MIIQTKEIMKKMLHILVLLCFCVICSCQSTKLKDAGLTEDKIMKDNEGNYFLISPHVGDTFFITPLDIDDYREF